MVYVVRTPRDPSLAPPEANPSFSKVLDHHLCCLQISLQTGETAESFPQSLRPADGPPLAAGEGKPFSYVTALNRVSNPTDGSDSKTARGGGGGFAGLGLFCDSWLWQPGRPEERGGEIRGHVTPTARSYKPTCGLEAVTCKAGELSLPSASSP